MAPAAPGSVAWVAMPPGGYAPPPPRRRGRYLGPPAYAFPPRWGFPLITWRRPTSIVSVPPGPALRAKSLAGTAVPLLWLAAFISLLAAVAELWRYRLLLASRFDALPAGQLRLSDALVVTGGVVAALACGLAALVSLLWVLRAYAAAADLAGVRPSRSPAVLVAGWLVPLANLVVPGSTLAEIEHAALGRPAAHRPTPSVLLLAWWASWVVGVLLAWLTIAWSFQDSTQAQADGVLLHAAADVVAAVVAVLTAIAVGTLTRLLQPVNTDRLHRMHLLAIHPPPAPAPAES